ncbi:MULTISPECIES: RidA family protein [Oerskovia]|uniref:RidA family protein n=1 Tax=Oerskovia TaxID=162491 RepID=UPI0006FF4F05|nr:MULTISPECIES: RidA family protein [unclassified Oerskovia]KRC35680.1 enamine deaminase RidA [Oerskovia sp. Root22]KRD36554.1 enamine deaminase RidA [Oerskovia sp. Root918]
MPAVPAAPSSAEPSTPAARLVRSPRLSDVAEYAYAAVVPSGVRLVYAAGACPLDDDGATVGVGDVRAQAARSMANLRISLEDAGATFADLVKTTVYVASTSQDDLVAAWEVVRDALAPHDPPSTLLGVAALGYDDQLVEVEAVAAVR